MKKVIIILIMCILIIIPLYFSFSIYTIAKPEVKTTRYILGNGIGNEKTVYISQNIAPVRAYTFTQNIEEIYNTSYPSEEYDKAKESYLKSLRAYESPSYILGE